MKTPLLKVVIRHSSFVICALLLAASAQATPGINKALSVKPSGDVVEMPDRVLNFTPGNHFKIDGIEVNWSDGMNDLSSLTPGVVGLNLLGLGHPSVPSFIKVSTLDVPSFIAASTIPTIAGPNALLQTKVNGISIQIGTAVGTTQSISVIDTPSDLWTITVVKSGGWAGNVTPVFRFPYSGTDLSFPKNGLLAVVGKPIQATSDDVIASASTLDLSTVKGPQVDVTDATPIENITLDEGQQLILRFTDATKLLQSSDLLLPGKRDITTAEGDYAYVTGGASGVVTVDRYVKAIDGQDSAIADFNGGTINGLDQLGLRNHQSSPPFEPGFDLRFVSPNSDTRMTADRGILFFVHDANRGINLSGNLILANDFTTNGNYPITLYASATTDATLPSGTHSLAPLDSPSFTTPSLGVATATSINKVTITAPASSATLTIANSKTLTASNTLTFAGTDGSTLNIGAGGTLGSAAFTASSAYVPTSYLDTDTTLAANSDSKVATQKATKAYVLAHAPSGGVIGTCDFDSSIGFVNWHDGIIDTATSNGGGSMTFTFVSAEPDTNYAVSCIAERDKRFVAVPTAGKTTNGFDILMEGGDALGECVVMRLSH